MIDYSNRKWVIVNISNVTQEMIDSAMQTSMSALRKSLDGTKAILKWDGDTPTCFDGMTTYSHSEILAELSGSDWTENE